MIGPLVVWLLKRETLGFAGECAKEALNFSITVAASDTRVCVLCSPCAFIGIPLMIALFIAWLILTIIAAVRASEASRDRYPVSIRFIR